MHTLHATFPRESYRSGDCARLVVTDPVSELRVQLYRAGTASRIDIGKRQTLIVGDWPSGLYFASLTVSGDRIGYAPFVLRPRRLGEHRVAVVLPTLNWRVADSRRQNRGMPPHDGVDDQPFLRWLQESRRDADYLAQSDLETATGAQLAEAYDLLVFPGQHESVTVREYDAVESYRDLGGNLMFLSANNFVRRVEKRGGTLYHGARWRDVGRPESALIGVQSLGRDSGEHRGPWIVRRAGASHWVFAGTGVGPGSEFSNGGTEIDKTAADSPRGTRVLAEIPNLLGFGMSGQMTYYETRRGAKVFAAGAVTLAGSVRQPAVQTLLGNLWARLGRDRN